MTAIAASFVSATRVQAQSPDSFEVVSVKPAGPVPATGPATNASGGAGRGCDGSFPRLDGSLFSVTTTPYALITCAYGYNKTWGCSWVTFGDLLTGGPSWIRTERFTIQAKIPEGATRYSIDQFMRGDAPGLEKMLQKLLAERFRLTVHRQTKSVEGYTLSPANGGGKLLLSPADDKRALGIRRNAGPNGQTSNTMIGRKVEMRDLAFLLVLTTQHPVVDRTGLTGEYSFDMDFAPFDSDAANDSGAPSLFTALQQTLGLQLRAAKVPLEGIVIDKAERPSEN